MVEADPSLKLHCIAFASTLSCSSTPLSRSRLASSLRVLPFITVTSAYLPPSTLHHKNNVNPATALWTGPPPLALFPNGASSDRPASIRSPLGKAKVRGGVVCPPIGNATYFVSLILCRHPSTNRRLAAIKSVILFSLLRTPWPIYIQGTTYRHHGSLGCKTIDHKRFFCVSMCDKRRKWRQTSVREKQAR